MIGAGLAVLVLALSMAAADKPDPAEPPARLKKKDREDSPDQKLELRKEGQLPARSDSGPGPDSDPAEVLARISKNITSLRQRLDAKDAGAGTQQIQRDVLKDIDKLIEQDKQQQSANQQQQNSQSSSRSSRSNSQMRNNTSSTSRQDRSAAGGQSSQRPEPKEGMALNGRSAGMRDKDQAGRLADLYKDIWGHLPEKLRQEMDHYSREHFMAKYRDLLEKYYATIAEKSRRKGD